MSNKQQKNKSSVSKSRKQVEDNINFLQNTHNCTNFNHITSENVNSRIAEIYTFLFNDKQIKLNLNVKKSTIIKHINNINRQNNNICEFCKYKCNNCSKIACTLCRKLICPNCILQSLTDYNSDCPNCKEKNNETNQKLAIENVIKLQCKHDTNSKKYKFMFIGKEGRREFDNDEFEYVSNEFDNFEDCYKTYLCFNIKSKYPQIGSLKSYILYDPNSKDDTVDGILTQVLDGMLYFTNCEDQLGILETELDNILEKIGKELKTKPIEMSIDSKKYGNNTKIYTSNGGSFII